MKGLILQINPKATIIDITHNIPDQDLFHAAFTLRQALPYFPTETIFVAVVDPTVGTSRPILVARYNDRIVLAPDNGLLTLVHRDGILQEMRTVENSQYMNTNISNTFHGRDIFAPVAAHVSKGIPLNQLGPVADHLEVLDLGRAIVQPDGTIQGAVILMDKFGNLVTNITAQDISTSRRRRASGQVYVGETSVGPVRKSYAEVEVGQPLALIGSSQLLEIAVNSGSAAKTLNIKRGDAVFVR
jgi:hypothetical protein